MERANGLHLKQYHHQALNVSLNKTSSLNGTNISQTSWIDVKSDTSLNTELSSVSHDNKVTDSQNSSIGNEAFLEPSNIVDGSIEDKFDEVISN